MSSYTTLAEYASLYSWMPAEVAEFSYGKVVAKQNRTAKHGTSWSIMECGEYRQASPDEAKGIEAGLVDLAAAVAMFGGDLLDELEADDWNAPEDLERRAANVEGMLDFYEAAWADSRDYYDTVASIRYGFQMC